MQKSFNVGAYAGQAVTLKLTGVQANSVHTSFVTDDYALNTSGSGGTAITVTVTSPGNQTGTVNAAASLQMKASDSASGQTFAWSASGLPAGLSIKLVDGGHLRYAEHRRHLLGDGHGKGHGERVWFHVLQLDDQPRRWLHRGSVAGRPGLRVRRDQLSLDYNEHRRRRQWPVEQLVLGAAARRNLGHLLNGWGQTDTDTLAQTATIPVGCAKATLTFWLHVDTAETTTTTKYDTLKLDVLNGAGTVLSTPGNWSNLDHNTGYAQWSVSLAAYVGQTITIRWTGSEVYTTQTSFVLDDTVLNVS